MASPVDSGPRVMWSVSQIAERDGISKQAVSKVVQSLIAGHDIPVERDSRGRVARVSLAHYDHHRGQFANPAKVAAARPSTHGPLADTRGDSFDEARRQNEWLKVEREKLAQAQERKQLVRADLLTEALERVGREIQSLVARLPNKADDLALAGAKEGVHGVRIALRAAANEINTAIADALSNIAKVAPAADAAQMDDAT
ncbi:hypothetical protein AncyloWKF20_05195 [Ancylobacter sp. WKF20]|uniref:hypothetical protein n=1 Tax=Ancylobacter sp. WKF20 TaxID=3039801 RepID=UPI00243457CD|nr:hypothetical protein [Ancylobacter sp. WKF20]WGD31220.1 hypothetical protein AncyloWKF20_05195 [Ancylobacter sp. WKF20]